MLLRLLELLHHLAVRIISQVRAFHLFHLVQVVQPRSEMDQSEGLSDANRSPTGTDVLYHRH